MSARGVCALCKQDSMLQDSHLMPKAMYRMLRSTDLVNPNPTIISDRAMWETSRQVKSFLLCSACEQRFHRNGEDWMLRYCCRANNEFKLREVLLQNSPVYDDGQVRVYCSRRIEQIDTEKLVYFAASVFWRAAVGRWRVDSTRLDEVELGNDFTEQFRRFLLLEGDFPEGAAITTEVFESHEPSLGTAVFPGGGRVAEYHLYRFALPGVRFKLFLAREFLKKHAGCAPTAHPRDLSC
jgi:hypothetical protein